MNKDTLCFFGTVVLIVLISLGSSCYKEYLHTKAYIATIETGISPMQGKEQQALEDTTPSDKEAGMNKDGSLNVF